MSIFDIFRKKGIQQVNDKEKVIDLNKEYKEYTQTYLIPFFRVIEDGCNKGIEWC